MKRTVHTLLVSLFFGSTISTSTPVNAAPITFNTALPVAKGAFINREQLIIKRFDNDTNIANRDLTVNGLISVLGYGITSKLAIFAALPYLDKTFDKTTDGQRLFRLSQGFGDLKMFGRYTFFQQDVRNKTFRVAGFGGGKAPTGKDNETDSLGLLPVPLQSGTGAWDSFVGVVLTYQTLDFQMDAQLSVEKNGRSNGFKMGNEVRADMSFQYRLLPQAMHSDTQSFFYGVLEANLINQRSNRLSGMNDPNSGGTTLFLTPGVQYVTSRYILEAAVQVPVIANLHGNALETDYVFTTGFRINF